MSRRKKEKKPSLADLANEANKQHRLCVESGRQSKKFAEQSVIHAKEAGDALNYAKNKLKWYQRNGKLLNGAKPPNFMDWVEKNFQASQTIANDYMDIARNWNKLQPAILHTAKPSIRMCTQFLRQARQAEKPADTSAVYARLVTTDEIEEEENREQRKQMLLDLRGTVRKQLNGAAWSMSALWYLACIDTTGLTTALWDLRRRIGPVGKILWTAKEKHEVGSYAYCVAALKEAGTHWTRMTPEQRTLLLLETTTAKNTSVGRLLHDKLTARLRDPVEKPTKGRWSDGTLAYASWQ